MKWAVLTARTKSEKDFELLTKMLVALGFGAREMERYESFRLQAFLPTDLILEVVYRKVAHVCPDLDLTISDPDSAIGIIEKMGLKVLEDHSGPEPKHTFRSFDVSLPGGTTIRLTGFRIAGEEPTHGAAIQGDLNASGKTFGIVVSRFNSFITERLLTGCIDCLRRSGVGSSSKDYAVVRVPGAFEIPLAARKLAETKRYDAIICIGCLLRGDTAHYDVIVNEVTRGIGQSAQETGVPHAFGVLTCDTLEQAIDRAGLKMGNKGFEAALAAIEMASLKQAIKTHPETKGRKQIPPSGRNDKRNNRNDKPAKTKLPGRSKSKSK
jgi:6,7-dimethyl-8-ribityllumazine synthase